MRARVTKTVYEYKIDMDATPMEGLYQNALAHLISDAYTQIHRDEAALMGMRTAIVSLLYKRRRVNGSNSRTTDLSR